MSRSHAIIEFGLDGTVLNANDKFLSVLGFNAEEVVGQHHSMFCRPGVAETPEYAAFWASLREGQYRVGEFRRVGAGGRDVYIEASYNPVLDAEGKPYKVVKLASDVTAARMKSLGDDGKLEAISRSQAVIEFDLTGHVLDANANFLDLLGYTLEEVKGQHHRMFVDDKEANSARYRSFWQKLNRGEFDSGEYLRIGRDDKRVWIQATYNPIFDSEGRPLKIVKFCSDVTQAKLASVEITGQMGVVSNSNCILEMALDGSVLKSNALLQQAIGYTEEQLIGMKEPTCCSRTTSARLSTCRRGAACRTANR